MRAHLILGTAKTGKTSKAIELAASALNRGQVVLFVNDTDKKDFIMGEIGRAMFTQYTSSDKRIASSRIVFDDNKDANNLSWFQSFDVVIVDCASSLVQDYKEKAKNRYYETRETTSSLTFFDSYEVL